MAKMSIGAKLFEKAMTVIWPGEDSKLKKTRYMSGNMDHWCRRCGKYWKVPLY